MLYKFCFIIFSNYTKTTELNYNSCSTTIKCPFVSSNAIATFNNLQSTVHVVHIFNLCLCSPITISINSDKVTLLSPPKLVTCNYFKCLDADESKTIRNYYILRIELNINNHSVSNQIKQCNYLEYFLPPNKQSLSNLIELCSFHKKSKIKYLPSYLNEDCKKLNIVRLSFNHNFFIPLNAIFYASAPSSSSSPLGYSLNAFLFFSLFIRTIIVFCNYYHIIVAISIHRHYYYTSRSCNTLSSVKVCPFFFRILQCKLWHFCPTYNIVPLSECFCQIESRHFWPVFCPVPQSKSIWCKTSSLFHPDIVCQVLSPNETKSTKAANIYNISGDFTIKLRQVCLVYSTAPPLERFFFSCPVIEYVCPELNTDLEVNSTPLLASVRFDINRLVCNTCSFLESLCPVFNRLSKLQRIQCAKGLLCSVYSQIEYRHSCPVFCPVTLSKGIRYNISLFYVAYCRPSFNYFCQVLSPDESNSLLLFSPTLPSCSTNSQTFNLSTPSTPRAHAPGSMQVHQPVLERQVRVPIMSRIRDDGTREQ